MSARTRPRLPKLGFQLVVDVLLRPVEDERLDRAAFGADAQDLAGEKRIVIVEARSLQAGLQQALHALEHGRVEWLQAAREFGHRSCRPSWRSREARLSASAPR